MLENVTIVGYVDDMAVLIIAPTLEIAKIKLEDTMHRVDR